MIPVTEIRVGDFLIGHGRVRSIRKFCGDRATNFGPKNPFSGRKAIVNYAKVCSFEENSSYTSSPDSISFDVPGKRIVFKLENGTMVDVVRAA